MEMLSESGSETESEMGTRFIRSLTLEELCLRTVIEHLDIFIYNKNSLIPQRHIDFLLHLYSEKCFREYINSRNKTEECLLWFLNPHNKKIWLPDITQNIMKRLQTVGPVITSLTLRKTEAAENELNTVISLVPHLSYLDLSETKCSDKTLLCVQRTCSGLVTLNVRECDVTDNGMLNLCGSNLSLKNLNILYTRVEYEGLVDILKGMPSLRCLTYDNMADAFFCIHEHGLQYCVEKNIQYNLTELIYENLDFTQDPFTVIKTWTLLCPKVEKVHILFAVSHRVLRLCSKFPCLKELKLRMRPNYDDVIIPDPLASFLPVAHNLSTLILCSVKVPSLALIECLKYVEVLHLKYVSFTDFNEEDVTSTDTKLDTLYIKNVDLDVTSNTYRLIALLMSLSKNVTKLTLSQFIQVPCALVDIILNAMKSLTYVEFKSIRNKLPYSSCRFFEIPSVQEVRLDFCTFSEPAHVAHQANTLSWCAVGTASDDDDMFDDDDDYGVNDDYVVDDDDDDDDEEEEAEDDDDDNEHHIYYYHDGNFDANFVMSTVLQYMISENILREDDHL